MSQNDSYIETESDVHMKRKTYKNGLQLSIIERKVSSKSNRTRKNCHQTCKYINVTSTQQILKEKVRIKLAHRNTPKNTLAASFYFFKRFKISVA